VSEDVRGQEEDARRRQSAVKITGPEASSARACPGAIPAEVNVRHRISNMEKNFFMYISPLFYSRFIPEDFPLFFCGQYTICPKKKKATGAKQKEKNRERLRSA